MKHEKMSKSRGNTVSIDEAVHRVFSVGEGFVFRSKDGRIVDWEAEAIWRDPTSGLFFTGSPDRLEVFLMQAGPSKPACEPGSA